MVLINILLEIYFGSAINNGTQVSLQDAMELPFLSMASKH